MGFGMFDAFSTDLPRPTVSQPTIRSSTSKVNGCLGLKMSDIELPRISKQAGIDTPPHFVSCWSDQATAPLPTDDIGTEADDYAFYEFQAEAATYALQAKAFNIRIRQTTVARVLRILAGYPFVLIFSALKLPRARATIGLLNAIIALVPFFVIYAVLRDNTKTWAPKIFCSVYTGCVPFVRTKALSLGGNLTFAARDLRTPFQCTAARSCSRF